MRSVLKISFFCAWIIFILFSRVSQAQNPERFQKEVDSIIAHNQSVDRSNLILFTGSSSIRLWKDLKSAFPNYNIINMGFGGSEMTDLLYYADKIIVSFRPAQVFIYEGDNDISFGRSAEQILAAADSILILTRQALPQSEIIFICAKPSLQRWKLKEKYEAFNEKLKAWTAQKKNVHYADVWSPMLDRNGTVKQDIFIEDGLHLNEKGYSIWENALRKFLPSKSK